MGVVRVQKNSNYSVISNVHLQDNSLSWKAKGILSYLLSKPDNWQIYIAQLKNESTDGRDSTASGIRELINAGYITREYSRNAAGQMTGRDYVVYETALECKTLEKPVNGTDKPKTENPTLGNSSTVKPLLLNTDINNNGLKENNDDEQTGAGADPGPGQEPGKDVSSSSPLSESELSVALAGLMALVPEQFQNHSIQKRIEKALGSYSVGYIRSAIFYTNDYSTENKWQKYRSYLGKTIDMGYAYGYKINGSADDPAITKSFEEMTDDTLKLMAGAGNTWASQELARRSEQIQEK